MLKQHDKLVGFEIKGHAEYADPGQDIVCSAISALGTTTILGLTERLLLPVGYESEEGYQYCVLGKELMAAQYEQAELLLDTMLLGLQAIQANYGEYLNITEREV